MTSNNTQKPAAGNSRAKLLAVVLLAVGLLVALTWKSSDEFVTEVDATPHTGTVPTSAGSALTPAESTTELPPLDLSWIVAHNPFDTKATEARTAETGAVAAGAVAERTSNSPATAAANLAGRAAPLLADKQSTSPLEMPTYEISAIITGGGNAAVLIGERVFHMNDLIDNRWRIVEIGSAGIVVKPASDPVFPSD